VLAVQGKQGKSVPLQWMGLPTPKDLQPFLGMASILLSRTIFAMAAYTIITSASTALGTLPAATHQVCLQLFWLLSYFPDPLSVAAQSLISRDRSSRPRVVLLARCLLSLAAALGATVAVACASSFFFGAGLFTADPAIMAAMRTIAPMAFASLVLCSLAMTTDGVSIGCDDYHHLPLVNLLALAATAGWLWWCRVAGRGLPAVWMGMVLFFAVRLAVHAVHHLVLNANSSVVAEALNLRQGDRKGGLAQLALAAAA
jgi:Na+-driven multidrug efflux pump